MGNFQSNKTRQMLAAYTNIVNEEVTKIYNSAVTECRAENRMKLRFGGGEFCDFKITNGNINASQTSGTSCALNSQNVNKLNAQFTTELTNKLTSFIKQEQKNKQGWFATAFSFQMNEADTAEKVTNQITNSFTTDFTNKCEAVANAFNDKEAVLCGVYDTTTIDLSQNALVTMLTSCVNENTVSIWTKNKVLNDLWQATDQKLASQQSGLDLKWLWIALAVVGGLLLVIGVFVLIMKARGNKPRSSTKIQSTKLPTTKVSTTKLL